MLNLKRNQNKLLWVFIAIAASWFIVLACASMTKPEYECEDLNKVFDTYYACKKSYQGKVKDCFEQAMKKECKVK